MEAPLNVLLVSWTDDIIASVLEKQCKFKITFASINVLEIEMNKKKS